MTENDENLSTAIITAFSRGSPLVDAITRRNAADLSTATLLAELHSRGFANLSTHTRELLDEAADNYRRIVEHGNETQAHGAELWLERYHYEIGE